MGFEFVFKEARNGKGYLLDHVNGVEPGGEYDVLEVPSSYRGRPVVGILRIDSADGWEYDPNNIRCKSRPHFKHLIFPGTIGAVGLWGGSGA